MVIHDIHGGYPLVSIQKAIENGPVEIVDLPGYKMVIVQFAFCMFTRPGISPETNLEMENSPSVVGRFPQQNRPNPRPCCCFFCMIT